MTTLVTGGCGVMGSWVVRKLLAQNESVVILDNREDRSLLLDVDADADVPIAVGDVTNLEAVRAVISEYRVTRIAHMAAILDDQSSAQIFTAYHVNVFGTMVMLEAARAAGLSRIVCLSSKDALGQLGQPYTHPYYEPVPLGLPTDPYGVYGLTKWTGEELAEKFAAITGMTVGMIRLMSTYGPGKGGRHKQTGLVSRVIATACRGEQIVVPVGGDQKTDLIYFGDVAQAVTRALTADYAGYELFQIGTGVVSSLYDVVDAIREVIPDVRASVGPGLDYGGRGIGNYYRFDITPASRILGYQPEFTLQDGVKDFVARYPKYQSLADA